MSTQPEAILENELIHQLANNGYQKVLVEDEASLIANLKTQLEKLNQLTFSDSEFKRVMNILGKGSVFERAKTLRSRQYIQSDDGDSIYFSFLDKKNFENNIFQITSQVTIYGTFKNRYDVTLLVNGLPIVQIELKKRGCEISEAYNQIHRYKNHSFSANAGLYQYVQLFVISNGVNSKYFANNRVGALDFKQTFFWSDENNKKITNLTSFTDTFLEKGHLLRMITDYMVLAQSTKSLMVLRPYQFYAVERIVNQVSSTEKNGYIWHTTGSGKTLTSFKASQILTSMESVDKVLFVVDRKDLDYQTTKEFNSFSEGSVDGTNNTNSLVKKMTSNNSETKLIVTTIQKLNNAIDNNRHKNVVENLKDKKVILIFDECHRSQFGETHHRIKKFFNNCQMFGFTGTPIFAENSVRNVFGKRTTKELFDECLHKYVITDAIRDENVLKFSVEYIGKYKKKQSSLNFVDIDVEGIDTKELLDSEDRLDKISNYILQYHAAKTDNKHFTGLFCVSSINTLIKYYDLFKSKNHNLKIATIFSYGMNEEPDEPTGDLFFDDDMFSDNNLNKSSHSRDKLEEYIDDYNNMFGTNYTTRDSKKFYDYYNDIGLRVKRGEIDILLVVSMFLTGFDSKRLNTLYVDKNLRYHGVVQAFSRTNRILGRKKSHGNIVCFRNLKKATDEAIALYSNKDAKEEILMQPYENYIEHFNDYLNKLYEVAPSVESVDEFQTDSQREMFVRAFRGLLRIQNTLSSFVDFSFNDVGIDEQTFADYKSKYLDLYEFTVNVKEKDSILNDVDFEIELIRRDKITVDYILALIASLINSNVKLVKKKKKQISDLINSEITLRSKRELIEKFIDQRLEGLKDEDELIEAYDSFWADEKRKALDKICADEKLDKNKLQAIVEEFIYSGMVPSIRKNIMDAMLEKQTILQRATMVDRVVGKIENFIETFTEKLAA